MRFSEIYDTVRAYADRVDAGALSGRITAALHITGADPGSLMAVIENGRMTVSDRIESRCDYSVRLSAETLEQLLSGRLKPAFALMTGKLQVQGDIGRLMQLVGKLRVR